MLRGSSKYAAFLFLSLILISFNTGYAAADFTSTKVGQLETNLGKVAKVGGCTEYFLSTGDEMHPQYYSGAIAKGTTANGLQFYIEEIRVDVRGWNPLGDQLSPDRFTARSVLVSPQDNEDVQDLLYAIWEVLKSQDPSGLLGAVTQTQSEGGGSIGFNDPYAYAKWERGFGGTISQEKGIRFGYQLSVDTEGTYHIKVRYKVWICAYDGIHTYHTGYITLSHDVYYTYDDDDGGDGGCPILNVYDGNGYVSEGLLDIHNDTDVEQTALLHTIPARVGNRYLLKLIEHHQTISHIDAVKLYARLNNGNVISLPLVSAQHSELGDVRNKIRHSDDVRVDVLGADHNSGTSQYIDLQFIAPKGFNVVEYIFWIEGYNAYSKF